ncbi:hypothetical protein G7Y89_g15376 [Cudoniella acicularis]|uniref:Uncharacterized protein n=1 Tax=Cudoniella acicularis TaxID=354080 RepID=A0A8H4QP76_9HELO|nr:hypothetical protein G7Y89_g15376 [Cudoniella acicularis]
MASEGHPIWEIPLNGYTLPVDGTRPSDESKLVGLLVAEGLFVGGVVGDGAVVGVAFAVDEVDDVVDIGWGCGAGSDAANEEGGGGGVW